MGGKAELPNGSFLFSSTDIKLVLSATCTKIDKTTAKSSLDITGLGYSAFVENIDGVLTIRQVSSF